MTKVLVTGASGQLGWTINQLSSEYPKIYFVFKTSLEVDITNFDKVEEAFSQDKYDYCINCAAYTNVEQAEKTPEKAFEVNANGIKNIALACKKYDVTLIHISTDYVFDGKKKEPYTTEDIPNPINEYGKSKLKGETHIDFFLVKYFIVRTSWLYCKDYGNNFYRFILGKAKKGEDLQIVDDQFGRPTNTYKLGRFIIEKLMNNQKSFGLYHFSDGEAMTWFGFAKKILNENLLENEVQLKKAKNYRTFAQRPIYSVLSINE